MCPIVRHLPNGSTRKLTNLGWLVRNAAKIERVEAHPADAHGGLLIVAVSDGGYVKAPFASREVMVLHWLGARRSLKGVEASFYLPLDKKRATIGSRDYRAHALGFLEAWKRPPIKATRRR